MKNIAIKVLLALGITCACQAASNDEKSALAFAKQYFDRSNAGDTSILAMIHDSAQMKTLRTDFDGTIKEMKMLGFQWRNIIRVNMQQIKESNDKIMVNNIAVVREKSGFRLTGVRYSPLKCTTDSAYSLFIKEEGSGYKVLEEFSKTSAISKCNDNSALNKAIETEVKAFKGKLPVVVDEETRLDSVQQLENQIVYVFTLLTLEKDEIEPEEFQEMMKPSVIPQVCQTKIKSIPYHGGGVVYKYKYSDGTNYTSIVLNRNNCN
jgi:hypothetical protein